jgi:iron(III) transport system permease protein
VPVLCALAVFFGIVILLPVGAILSSALLKAWGLPLTPENLSLDNFRYVLFEYELTQKALRTSFLLALAAATATTVLGSLAAYLQVKTRVKGRHMLDLLATLPYAVPGTVIGLAMILAWSGAFALNLYNTFWIILIAYVARYLTFPFRNVGAMLRQVHPSLEEAATVCGAGWLRRFRDVIVPLIKPGLVASWFLVFIPTLRELTISILLWGPRTPTIGVAVFEMQDAGDYTSAAALGALILVVVVTGNLVLRRVLGVRFRV